MDSLIQISKLNDFLYSPKSLYFRQVYEDYETSVYHDTPQQLGLVAHESIDTSKYSNAKRYITSLAVSSEEYFLTGKIDVYDLVNHELIERKKKIKKVHLGHRMQLVGQAVCLIEEGFVVDNISIYSMDDNKKYDLGKITSDDLVTLKSLVNQISHFDLQKESGLWESEGLIDDHSIYKELYF